MNGDGITDLITGSNCCAATIVHFFAGKADGGFAEPVNASLVLGDIDRKMYPGKHEGRPHIVDWDGDGQDDLLFVTRLSESTVDSNGQTYRPRYQLFANTQLDSRSLVAELSDKTANDDIYYLGLGKGSGQRCSWRVETVDLTISDEPVKKGHSHFLTANPELCRAIFADYDGDGRIDVLFPKSNYTYSPDSEQKEVATFVDSGIYLMKNRSKSGLHDFAPPVRIHLAPENTHVASFSLPDVDQDGRMDVVASHFQHGRAANDMDGELWLLTQTDK